VICLNSPWRFTIKPTVVPRVIHSCTTVNKSWFDRNVQPWFDYHGWNNDTTNMVDENGSMIVPWSNCGSFTIAVKPCHGTTTIYLPRQIYHGRIMVVKPWLNHRPVVVVPWLNMNVWSMTYVPWYNRARPSSLGGYPVTATSAVGVFAAAWRAAHSSSDCWRPSVRCCRSDALEQSATRHYWLSVTDVILPETFLSSVSFPWLHFSFKWTLRILLRPLKIFMHLWTMVRQFYYHWESYCW